MHEASHEASHETSATLLGLLKSRDQTAWRQFHELYPPFIRRVLVGMGLVDTDDLVQDVVITVLESLPGFDRRTAGSFRCWLRQITRYRALAFLKSANRGGTRRQIEEIDSLADDTSDPSRRWDEEHDRYVLDRAVELARNEFGDRVYRAFVGTAILGRPAAEVAEELGMSPASVYAARHRVQSRIRVLVHGFIDEPGM